MSLLYSVRDEYKNKQLVFDYKRGEIIDPSTGEVIEDHLIESMPAIRASDYAEWESKRHHEVFVSDNDRHLWGVIWSIGERIGAPKWLRDEVLWFYKVSMKVRGRPELSGRCLILRVKCVLAAYYVVAVKRGLVELAERIASMPCNESGTPCYKNRGVKDREFSRYVSLAFRVWNVFSSVSSYRDVVRNYIRCFCFPIAKAIDGIDALSVARRALEMLDSVKGVGSYKPKNLAVGLLIKAVTDTHGDGVAKRVLEVLRKKHGISVLSVRSILRKLSDGGKGG